MGKCNKNCSTHETREWLLLFILAWTSHWDPTEPRVERPTTYPCLGGLHHLRGSLEGAHLVLISARSRTTAITGAEPSPVAGSEVWMERLPSWGSSMDWTAWTTFSVMDNLWRGNAWGQRVKFKPLVYKTGGDDCCLEFSKFQLKNIKSPQRKLQARPK